MGKSYRKYNNKTYSDEKDDNIKDANKKLKAEIKSLKKQIRDLELEKQKMTKSSEHNNEVFRAVQKDRPKEYGKKECPKCSTPEGKEFKIIEFNTFKVHTCVCGYRTRINNSNEGIERS